MRKRSPSAGVSGGAREGTPSLGERFRAPAHPMVTREAYSEQWRALGWYFDRVSPPGELAVGDLRRNTRVHH